MDRIGSARRINDVRRGGYPDGTCYCSDPILSGDNLSREVDRAVRVCGRNIDTADDGLIRKKLRAGGLILVHPAAAQCGRDLERVLRREIHRRADSQSQRDGIPTIERLLAGARAGAVLLMNVSSVLTTPGVFTAFGLMDIWNTAEVPTC